MENVVKKLVEAINIEGEWANEYNTTHGDAPIRDFVASAFYNEAELELNYIESNMENRLEILEKALPETEFRNFLIESSNTEYVNNFYNQKNSILSMCVGEIEHQLSDDTTEKMEKLTDDQRNEIQEKCEPYLKDGCIYIDCTYDFFHLILDQNAIDEKLLELNY